MLTARRHQNLTATRLQQEIHLASHTTFSSQTFRNWLHAAGPLNVRKPRICATLIGRHHDVCRELTMAIEQVNCRWNDWCNNFFFFDEPRFLAYFKKRIFILKERDVERICVRKKKCHIWRSGTMYTVTCVIGFINLPIIWNAALTGHLYKHEILRPTLKQKVKPLCKNVKR